MLLGPVLGIEPFLGVSCSFGLFAQGPRYNVLLEGARGKPGERRELKSLRGFGGTPLEKLEAKPFRLG